jgi:hypothetical protein
MWTTGGQKMAASDDYRRPLSVSDEGIADAPASGDGVRTTNLGRHGRRGGDRPARWLTASMAALGVLAGASAVVSFAAQYRMVLAAKAVAPVAALEAGIPDVAALIFASLGIALALHGRRTIRARVLNVGAVGTLVAMDPPLLMALDEIVQTCPPY